MKKEIIRSTGNTERKISVAQLKEMLNSEGENYTDEEVAKIRDFFYLLIHIELEVIKSIYREYEKENDNNSSEQDEYKMAS